MGHNVRIYFKKRLTQNINLISFNKEAVLIFFGHPGSGKAKSLHWIVKSVPKNLFLKIVSIASLKGLDYS